MNKSDAHEELKEARKATDLADALHRLEDNADFQLIITQKFLHDEMLRCASLFGSHLLTQNGLTQAEIRENIARDLHAKATLEFFLDSIYKKAIQAQETINSYTEHEIQEDTDDEDYDTQAGY